MDVVYIFIGGRTAGLADLHSSLSGTLTAEQRNIVSNNNWLIVQFHADSAVQTAGFTATWKTGTVKEVSVTLGITTDSL